MAQEMKVDYKVTYQSTRAVCIQYIVETAQALISIITENSRAMKEYRQESKCLLPSRAFAVYDSWQEAACNGEKQTCINYYGPVYDNKLPGNNQDIQNVEVLINEL